MLVLNIFDIMGPAMVGPSSPHTAGAVRMGFVGRKLLGFQPARAKIALHGSFAATGAGHGIDKAIVAGLLAMKPDDPNIIRSFELAEEYRLDAQVKMIELRDAPPNTAVMTLIGERGRTLVVNASSLGDGHVRVNSIDGMAATFTADTPTLIIRHQDKPGVLTNVCACLAHREVEPAAIQYYRNPKDDDVSVIVIEFDQPLKPEALEDIQLLGGVVRCIYID